MLQACATTLSFLCAYNFPVVYIWHSHVASTTTLVLWCHGGLVIQMHTLQFQSKGSDNLIWVLSNCELRGYVLGRG